MIGNRLGPYEITAKLGEGGMGQVWKAKDFHLGRDVALKVLPEGFTSDPERLARFEREAKLLAQLNHPNIAQIYGFEASGDTRALVMELVDGPTLAERLEAGPLPFNESLSISLQIAHALEEAHEKGIVHRDLKPQNIKASMEGKVKVLDFGLAKAMDPVGAASGGGSGSASQLAQSPTLTLGATVQGMILGTAAYMAPEQARGVTVDKRADIWAFGVVLFEMLSGRRLFEGELVTDVLANVLKSEVRFDALPPEVPASIRRLLRRCLERNPKNRLHDIADARIVLEEVAAGRSDDVVSTAIAASLPPQAVLWRRALPWALALAALGWAGWTRFEAPSPERRSAASSVAFTVPWRSAEGRIGLLRSVTVSRDGRRLVLWDSLGDALLLRDLDRVATRPLLATAGAGNPFFSPDGEWLGFNADGALKKLPLAGGDPVTLCDAPSDAPGGSWGEDGFVYYTPGWTSGLWRVSANGGKPEQLTEPERGKSESLHLWPSLLPGGGAAIFTIQGTAGMRDARIALLDLASRKIEIVAAGGAAQYVASGHLVFFRHGAWFAVPFDARSRRVTGAERRVLADARPLNPVGGRERTYSFSESGLLAYIAAPNSYYSPHTQLAWIDRAGRIERLPFEGQHEYNSFAVAPDGRRVAVALSVEGELQVWTYDLERGTRDRLTRDGLNQDPAWHPDGSKIAATGLYQGNYDLRLLTVGGAAPPAELVASRDDDSELEWHPDGRGFVYVRGSAETGLDIWTRSLDDAATARPVIATPLDENLPRLSADGRWILFERGETLYVTSFPDAGDLVQIPSDDRSGAWSPTTPELFVVAKGRLVAYRYESASGRFRLLDPRELFEVPRLPVVVNFVVARDAQRFLFLVPVPGKTLEPEVRVITDGFAELREPPSAAR